jgi:exodeoxyribonuclease VII large subunit
VDVTYTVAELNRVIARALQRAFPDEVWVSGEIRNLTRHSSGHVYFTLIDGEVGEPVPQLPVVLFAGDKEAVNRALVRVSAGRMVDGMQVRIRGMVGHQPGRGVVQLRMRWIDTEYTLGRLAAERRAVLEGLAAAGLLDRQGTLPLPVAPERIGLVTSVGSAAHADFLDELRRSGFGFVVVESHATVQGVGAAESIVAALAALAAHRPEVVALVRGGGAQTDLAVFDSAPVARAVATAPFPVLTGIGHEIDETVADRVAARSVKTPTACAQLVVGMVRGFTERLAVGERGLHHVAERVTLRAGRSLDERVRRLALVTSTRFGSHRIDLARTGHRLDTAATGALRGHDRHLDRVTAGVLGGVAAVLDTAVARSERAGRRLLAAPRALAAERRRLDGLAGVVRANDPGRMLARGWSVTRTVSGSLVRSPRGVAIGDHVVTTVAGGTLRSVVEGAEQSEGTAR